jgi:CHAT domain-containing protein
LPRLAATDFPADAVAITGPIATPSRVLAELATATYAELHAHGVANLAEPGTSFLALSPDRDGTWQLTAAAVAGAKLAAHPVIVLGACRAASTTPRWDARWSLPDAFLTAGARAVIAADVDLPDREAAALFARLRARLAKGQAPAAAVAAERSGAIAAGQAWAAHLMVFE